MSDQVTVVDRPTRWQTPFSEDLSAEDVEWVLARAPFSNMDQSEFPKSTRLEDIIRFDARLVRAKRGQILVRDGEYGNSAFSILQGQVRVVLGEGLPADLLGRSESKSKSYFEAFSQLWSNNKHPEARALESVSSKPQSDASVVLDDVDTILSELKTAQIPEGQLFGELAALGRIPRTATVFAEDEAILLEIRWQGIREISRFNAEFKNVIEQKYRDNALKQHLQDTGLFINASEKEFESIIQQTLFETHGSFDWYIDYKKGKPNEPVIANEGDYPDGLILVRAGFARVSRTMGAGQQTLTYLSAGDLYGLHEVRDLLEGKNVGLETRLSALGYVDLIRIPLPVLKKHVFPHLDIPEKRLIDNRTKRLSDTVAEDWLLDNRLINATQAMAVDLDKCVRCDDCVKACASTHDGNPRFKRQGKVYENWMITNACMHCVDPVCMIGCPTGAIHRTTQGGQVVINDSACIGCGTCANSCPYDNITLVEISDSEGRAVVDPKAHKPIVKATKCDLCYTNPGGPACVQACPHDALFRVDFDKLNPLTGDM